MSMGYESAAVTNIDTSGILAMEELERALKRRKIQVHLNILHLLCHITFISKFEVYLPRDISIRLQHVQVID